MENIFGKSTNPNPRETTITSQKSAQPRPRSFVLLLLCLCFCIRTSQKGKSRRQKVLPCVRKSSTRVLRGDTEGSVRKVLLFSSAELSLWSKMAALPKRILKVRRVPASLVLTCRYNAVASTCIYIQFNVY